MSGRDDGGPAFPANHFDMADGEHGMTLRDYFATHSVQPGAGEIVSMAGFRYSNGGVWVDERTRLGNFDEWFCRLPLDERLRLFSRVKYAMADAMLAARKEPPK